MLRDAIPVFTGDNAAITQKWLDAIEKVIKPHPKYHEHRVSAARAKLSGAAAAKMADYVGQDWEEFKASLLSHFNPRIACTAIKLELRDNTRYASGSFMTALDRAVTDHELLGAPFATSILDSLGTRVPEVVLESIGFISDGDFGPTIEKLRERATMAQMRVGQRPGWASEAVPMAMAVTTGHRKDVEAKPRHAQPAEEPRNAQPAEGSRPAQSKNARRRARAKAKNDERLHAVEGRQKAAGLGANAKLDF
jgi:hypothetical protein